MNLSQFRPKNAKSVYKSRWTCRRLTSCGVTIRHTTTRCPTLSYSQPVKYRRSAREPRAADYGSKSTACHFKFPARLSSLQNKLPPIRRKRIVDAYFFSFARRQKSRLSLFYKRHRRAANEVRLARLYFSFVFV